MSSFESVLKQVNGIINRNDIRVLSLDVFDTILHRSCPPQAVLDAVDRFVLSKAIEYSIDTTVNQIEYARRDAYLRCANKNVELGLDQETHVSEFFPVWMEIVGFDTNLTDKVAAEVLEYELQLEEQLLHCDPGIVEIIKSASIRNIRVIYCSDMYLPGYFIDRVLEKYEVLKLISGRYVSSEYKKLKRSGELFRAILDTEQVAPEQIIHIGDNVTSDFINAKKAGIHGVWLSETSQFLRRMSLEYDYANRQDKCAQAMLSGELGIFNTESTSLPYSVGRRFLGPAYTSFITDVIDKAKNQNIEKVFFLAREGYALKRIYDTLAGYLQDDAPPSSYIAGSRILSLIYSIDSGLGLRHLADIFSNTSHFTIQNILAPFSIPAELVEDICEKNGISSGQTLPPNFMEWPPFIRISEDTQLNDLLVEKANEHRTLYTEYLKSVGLIGTQRIMLVDVGWGGQIQDNLFRGLQLSGNEPEFMTGCYLALNEKAHQRKLPKSWKEWSLADKGHLEWNGYSCFDTVFIYEAAVRAPHGTVLRLHKNHNDGLVYPLLKTEEQTSRNIELKDDPALAQLQKGIIEFAESFALMKELYPGFGYEALKPYALSCVGIVNRFPSFDKYSWLASVGNVADLGSDKVNVAGASVTRKISFSLKSTIMSAAWREYVAYNTLGIVGVVILSIVKYGRSIPRRINPLIPPPPFIVKSSVDMQPLYTSIDNCNDNHEVESYLYRLAEENHYKMCEKGEKEAVWVSGRYKDALTKDVIASFFVYKITNIFLRIRGRHRFYNEGLALRYVVKRYAFSRVKQASVLCKKIGFLKLGKSFR